jgi:hypothetical protein
MLEILNNERQDTSKKRDKRPKSGGEGVAGVGEKKGSENE